MSRSREKEEVERDPAKEDEKVKPDQPSDAKDAPKTEPPPDANAESVHGIPPGTSFDTEEGRRAQGREENIGHKPRDEDHDEGNEQGR